MDARIPARMTFTNAINIMLSVIGEQPYNSVISGNVAGDVEIAKSILGETSQAVQSLGWAFNTDIDYELQPNSDDQITIPSTCIRLSMKPCNNPEKRYVQRAGKLYDRILHTFTMSSTKKVDIVWFLSFDNLPETAKRYITIKAARVFQGRFLSSQVVHGFTELDEMDAKNNMTADEAETLNASILDTWEMAMIVHRPGNTYGGV